MHDRLYVNSLNAYDNGAFIRYGHFVGTDPLSEVYDDSGFASTPVFEKLVNNKLSNFYYVWNIKKPTALKWV
jgi:hypothetical protein